jgi:hypothetical protein
VRAAEGRALRRKAAFAARSKFVAAATAHTRAKDGTVASGHSSILTARSWPHWQVTDKPRMPCRRVLPSVVGRISSSLAMPAS